MFGDDRRGICDGFRRNMEYRQMVGNKKSSDTDETGKKSEKYDVGFVFHCCEQRYDFLFNPQVQIGFFLEIMLVISFRISVFGG